MGKGSFRRPGDEEALAKNWPFPAPKRKTAEEFDEERQLELFPHCKKCHAPHYQLGPNWVVKTCGCSG